MQKEAWKKEYDQANLASTLREQPSRALVSFLERIDPPLTGAKVIEFGCGNGRNLIYLAKHGAICTGVDFVERAVETARAKVKARGLEDKVTIIEADMGEPLPFPDGTFDIGLDFLAGNSLFERAWETYKREVVRVLRPGGYFVTYFFNADSPEHWSARNDVPGPYPNSIVHPHSGIVERAFSKEDMVREFPDLVPVTSDVIEFTDVNYQQSQTLSMLFTVLQKQS